MKTESVRPHLQADVCFANEASSMSELFALLLEKQRLLASHWEKFVDQCADVNGILTESEYNALAKLKGQLPIVEAVDSPFPNIDHDEDLRRW